jgi:hypothetical protein
MVSPRSFASGSGRLEAASPVLDPVWGALGVHISDGSGGEPEWESPRAGGSVIDIGLVCDQVPWSAPDGRAGPDRR